MLKHKEFIGSLDERISIRSFTVARNDFGEETLTWSTAATLWAKVEYANTGSDEKQPAGQETAFRRVEFTIRYGPTVTEKMRVQYRNEEYDILFINEISRKRFVKLVCELRK